MDSHNLAVRLDITETSIREEFAKILSSVGGFTVVGSSKPCDLVILEVSNDADQAMEEVNRVQASGEADNIFLTAKSVEPNMLIYALRAGVGEFFPQPLKKEDVVAALVKLRQSTPGKTAQQLLPGKEGQIFTVFGTKGGIGTTTVAVNLATAMARLDDKPSVALIDMNLLFGEVPVFLNMKPVFDWMEVARNTSRLDATYLMSILQRHSSGVHVLPTPIKVVEQFGVAPEVIEKVLRLVQTMFDFIIIDGGQSLGNVSRYIVGMSDKVVLVAVPSLPGIINLKKMLGALIELGYPQDDTVVVVNRYNQKSGISIAEVKEMTKKDIKWSLPNDYRNTMSAINTGEPLTATALSADITKKIVELASSLTGKGDAKKKEKKGFFGML